MKACQVELTSFFFYLCKDTIGYCLPLVEIQSRRSRDCHFVTSRERVIEVTNLSVNCLQSRYMSCSFCLFAFAQASQLPRSAAYQTMVVFPYGNISPSHSPHVRKKPMTRRLQLKMNMSPIVTQQINPTRLNPKS